MIEALDLPDLAPHTILVSLYFLLRNRFQRDLARDVDRLRRRRLRGEGLGGNGGGAWKSRRQRCDARWRSIVRVVRARVARCDDNTMVAMAVC
jgi:hypothetical protein